MKLFGHIPVWVCLVVSAVGGLFTTHAFSQSVQQGGLRPVDQTVEDMDPSQISLRREYTGLSTIGERQNVFRRIVPDAGPYNPGQQRLYFVSYGVVAEFDRSQYAIVTDKNSDLKGGIIQFIPPNTVFHIGMPPAQQRNSASDDAVPGMVQARVDGNVQNTSPYDLAIDGRWIAPSQSRIIDTDANDAQRYGELVVVQRSMVVSAIQRVSKTPSP